MNPLLGEWATGALTWTVAIAVFGGAATWWLRRRRRNGRCETPADAGNGRRNPPQDDAAARLERLRFQALMDQVPHPSWLRAPDFQIIYANEAYASAVGAPSRIAAVVRQSELGHGSLDPDGRSLARRTQRTGVEQTESATVVVGGTRRLFQFSETLLDTGWIAGRAQDMSAIDALQSDLMTHMEAHQEVLEQLRAGVAVFDGSRRLRFVNRAYAELWGLDYDWLNGNPLLTEILEVLRQKRRLPEVTDFAEFRRRMERRFQTLLEPEEQLVHLPDSRCFREVTAPHPLGGLLFVLEDVTDRLALETSYNSLIAVQRGVLDQLADGVAAFGTDGRVAVFNPALLRLLGFAEGQLDTGVHVGDLLDRLAPMIADADAWRTFRDSAAYAVTGQQPIRHRLFLTDGRALDIAFAPLSDGTVLMSARDITDTYNVERVLLERNAALEEANRLKTDFLANASYELRTPLTTISGFAELLQSQLSGPLNAVQHDYLDGVMHASDTLAALIDSILDVSLGEAGQWDFGTTEIALAPIVNSVAAVVRPQIETQGLTFDVRVSAGTPTMQADERRLRQLVFNLLSSAARHNRNGEKIDLSCSFDDRTIEIAARLYNSAGHFDHRVIQNELGLTLVQRLAELHGGRMTVTEREHGPVVIACRLPRRRPPLDQTGEPAA